MRAQLGVVVELDQLGVGLSCFFRLGALDLRRQQRAAVGDELARIVGPLARPGECQVRVAAERQPPDLAGALSAVCEGEGLYPLRRDPDAEAGAGGIADRVKGLPRLETPNNRVG